MKHILLHNEKLKGVEYGTLDSFEKAIEAKTSATRIPVPSYKPEILTVKGRHGTRWGFLRKYFPKNTYSIHADVAWYILMGPESYELDLFREWNKNVRHRIVYLFDTLEPQFPLIEKLFSNDHFNICITSFHDAVPALESRTGKKWHAVEQAVPEFFKPVPSEERVIDISSYGRRLPGFHEALKEYCSVNKLYYDYSMQYNGIIDATHEELYRQYAWNLCHSKFTVSWPVELTNPKRAGHLSPITCRWFEGASAGTIILGQKPGNPMFDKILSPGVVNYLDPLASKTDIWKKLDGYFSNCASLTATAERIAYENHDRWQWHDRVERILKLISDYTHSAAPLNV